MITRKVIAVLALCASAGCVSQQTQAPDYKPTITQPGYKLSAAEITVVQTGVRKSLKDPNSAMFGAMLASRGEKGAVYVCGLVNAKNSFGGYTGDEVFYGMLAVVDGKPLTFGTIGMGETDTDRIVAQKMCNTWGIPL